MFLYLHLALKHFGVLDEHVSFHVVQEDVDEAEASYTILREQPHQSLTDGDVAVDERVPIHSHHGAGFPRRLRKLQEVVERVVLCECQSRSSQSSSRWGFR